MADIAARSREDRGMTQLRVLVVGNDVAEGLRTLPEGDALQLETAASIDEVLANPHSVDVVVIDRRHIDPGSEGAAKLAKAIAPVPLVVVGDDESVVRTIFAAADRAWLRASLAAALDELESQRNAVMQISQLKHDLVATMAHDIKGPLTSIIGFAELLEEGFLEGDDATDAARTIRTNAQRLATLANDILALSRVEHGELELADDRVDVVDVLRSAIESVAAEREIVSEFGIPSAFVRGDTDRLRQVFDNLLRNAIKYSPGGELLRVALTESGTGFAVAVEDHGIGIPADEIPKLFNRFARASNARKAKIAGTGVGLFIVKTIVERHGGNVALTSTLGSGSTFSVTLPAIERTQDEGPGRVAIVTKDGRLSRFTAFELRARGFRVREVNAMADAAAGARPGDVIVVDAQTAGAQETREALGQIAARIIGVGAANASGWDATLPKPFLVSDLLLAVKP
jgi:signal transduction histidine kinase